VAEEVEAAGFTAMRRSQIKAEPLDPSARRGDKGSALSSAVWIIDTVGELKNMYKAADVAFIGGSLIPHGGQNVMEPCGLGVPVLHGPHMHNFNDAMALLNACSGSVEVSRESFGAELEKLLQDRTGAGAMAQRAREAFLKQQGATARAVDFLAHYL
jgi:3-deoxy-D-manno-octulosonic-acid transferase